MNNLPKLPTDNLSKITIKEMRFDCEMWNDHETTVTWDDYTHNIDKLWMLVDDHYRDRTYNSQHIIIQLEKRMVDLHVAGYKNTDNDIKEDINIWLKDRT